MTNYFRPQLDADGSTWSKLFKESSQPENVKPKRLVNGAPLLSSGTVSDTSAFARESQLRKRLSRTQDPEIVKVSLDGMSLVQVIDVVKEGLGLDIRVAQVVHRELLDVLEEEHEQAVPVHLDSVVVKREYSLLQHFVLLSWRSFSNELTIHVPPPFFLLATLGIVLLLQYYSDQGGAWSRRALDGFKVRFNNQIDTEMNSSGVSSSGASSVAMMPNFFQAAAMAS